MLEKFRKENESQEGHKIAPPNRTFCDDVSVLYNIVTASHKWLMSSWNVTSLTKELNFLFFVTLIVTYG